MRAVEHNRLTLDDNRLVYLVERCPYGLLVGDGTRKSRVGRKLRIVGIHAISFYQGADVRFCYGKLCAILPVAVPPIRPDPVLFEMRNRSQIEVKPDAKRILEIFQRLVKALAAGAAVFKSRRAVHHALPNLLRPVGSEPSTEIAARGAFSSCRGWIGIVVGVDDARRALRGMEMPGRATGGIFDSPRKVAADLWVPVCGRSSRRRHRKDRRSGWISRQVARAPRLDRALPACAAPPEHYRQRVCRDLLHRRLSIRAGVGLLIESRLL